MKSVGLLAVLLLFFTFSLKAQDVEWSTSIGSPGAEFPFTPIVDAQGNIYVVYYTYHGGVKLVKCDGATGRILLDEEFVSPYPVVDKNGDIWIRANNAIEKFFGDVLVSIGRMEDIVTLKLWRDSYGNIYDLRLPAQGTEYSVSFIDVDYMREKEIRRIEGFGAATINNIAIDDQGRSYLLVEYREDLAIDGKMYPSTPALEGTLSKAVVSCNSSGEKQWAKLFYNCGNAELLGDGMGNIYIVVYVGPSSYMGTDEEDPVQIQLMNLPATSGSGLFVMKVDGETGKIIHTELIVPDQYVTFADLQVHEAGRMSIGTRTYMPTAPYNYSFGRLFLDPENCGRRVLVNDPDETSHKNFHMDNGILLQTVAIPEGTVAAITHTVTSFSDSTDILLVKRRSATPYLGECNKETIQIFPNPARDEVTITVSNTDQYYTITFSDISGKVLYRADEHDTFRPTNIEDLAPGVYFVTVTTISGERYTRRFLKAL